MFRDGVQHLGLYSHLAQPGCGTDELFHFAHLIDSDRAITTCAASEIVLFTPPPKTDYIRERDPGGDLADRCVLKAAS